MILKTRIAFFLGTLAVFACKKLNYFPEVLNPSHETLILAHRGGGDAIHEENSLKAARLGLRKLDGIELDIQISQDGTLWMSHEHMLMSCNGLSYQCFSQHSDEEIRELNRCLGKGTGYNQLESVFQEMKMNHPEDYISLDIKPWFPCTLGDLAVHIKLKEMADKIVELAFKYQLSSQVFVESENISFLKALKARDPLIECHLLAFSNLPEAGARALRNQLDGISYKFDSNEDLDLTDLINRGLKIQLWTVNDSAAMIQALSLKPHTIQTDRLDW